MRRLTVGLALIGLVAAPALAQNPPLLQSAPPAAAPPTCACVQPAPARPSPYRRTTYRRRSTPPVPSYSTSITPGPFVFGTPPDLRYPLSAPRVGFAEFDTSGYFRGLGPNGTGLLDGSITDGVMGGPAGLTGPGPNSIGW